MKIYALLLIILFSGCTNVVKPKYTAPKERTSLNKNVIEINKPFDDVWQSLVEYSSKSFFGIKNFEKDSGLLTLSFGVDQPGKYVDCGEVNAKHVKFEGPYLSAVETTGYGHIELSGIMNLFVKPINDKKTSVSVNTRYILNIKDGAFKKIWSFDSNGKQTKKMGVLVITCRSTLVAEDNIISGINLIAQKNE